MYNFAKYGYIFFFCIHQVTYMYIFKYNIALNDLKMKNNLSVSHIFVWMTTIPYMTCWDEVKNSLSEISIFISWWPPPEYTYIWYTGQKISSVPLKVHFCFGEPSYTPTTWWELSLLGVGIRTIWHRTRSSSGVGLGRSSVPCTWSWPLPCKLPWELQPTKSSMYIYIHKSIFTF